MLQWFNGQAVNLVAKGSAVTQQELLTQHFPGTEAYATSGSPLCLLLLFPVGTIQVFNLLLSRSSTTVPQKKGCKTQQQIGRFDVPTRNLVLCDPKTNKHIQIFPSESSKALLLTTTDHFTQTSLTLAQKQQILIIESELTPSFIKGPKSTDILAARHTSKDKHTSTLMLLSCSYKSFLTVQLNCWRNGKVQQLARAKDLFYCLYVHLYAHLPSSALLLAIAHPISKKKVSVSFRFLSITWPLNLDPLCSSPC